MFLKRLFCPYSIFTITRIFRPPLAHLTDKVEYSIMPSITHASWDIGCLMKINQLVQTKYTYLLAIIETRAYDES